MMFFIVSKKNITVAGIALAAILTLGLVASAVNPAKAPSFLVVIDAGHGEPDGGCVGHLGSVEQKINLSVAKKVSEILEAGVSGDGGAKNAAVDGYKIAAKTGTSQKFDVLDANGNSYRVTAK